MTQSKLNNFTDISRENQQRDLSSLRKHKRLLQASVFSECSINKLTKTGNLKAHNSRFLNTSLFSYVISADKRIPLSKDQKIVFRNTLKMIIKNKKQLHSSSYLQKIEKSNDFVSSLYVINKNTDSKLRLDPEIIQQNKIKEDINYKNSFLEKSFEKTVNPTIVLSTATNGSKFHPLKGYDPKNNSGELNETFFEGLLEYLNSIELSNKIKDIQRVTNEHNQVFTNYDLLEMYVDKVNYDGYMQLENFQRNFYKQNLFKEKLGGLTDDKRSRILAFEPHKDFHSHLHNLEIFDKEYLFNYIKTFVTQHHKYKLGRSEIAIFENDFKDIKVQLQKKYGLKKVKNGFKLYKTEHTKGEFVYIRLLEDQKNDKRKSIANYLTNYIETNQVILNDNERKNNLKKNSVIYNAYALYIAELKDKFQPNKDTTPHKKIRRIRFSNNLVARDIYRGIMKERLIKLLQNKGDYQKHNMYKVVTDLIRSEELKVFRMYSNIENVDLSTGEITQDPNKDFVARYLVEYKGDRMVLDNMENITYRSNGKGKKATKITKNEQISIGYESFHIQRYMFEDNRFYSEHYDSEEWIDDIFDPDFEEYERLYLNGDDYE